MCIGAADILNINPENINNIPSIMPNEFSIEPAISKLSNITSKFVSPAKPYTNEDPNNIKPEAKAPKMKYLTAASDDKELSLFKATKIYVERESSSKPKYAVIRSLADISKQAPIKESNISIGNSKQFSFQLANDLLPTDINKTPKVDNIAKTLKNIVSSLNTNEFENIDTFIPLLLKSIANNM
jgi:hypothetical protein